MSKFKQDVTDNSFKAVDMTPENIANAFNLIDRRFIEIDRRFVEIERRLDEMPDKIIKDIKLWILSLFTGVLVTGILIPIIVSMILFYLKD